MKLKPTALASEVLVIPLDEEALVGPILRRIHREQPKVLIVWIDSREQSRRAELIAELRRRRPQLPLIAACPEHDLDVEQAARIAGAAFYLPITCAADERLLHHTLESLGIQARIPGEHSGLPPPPRENSCLS